MKLSCERRERTRPGDTSGSTGELDSQESYSGGVSFGFSTPWADFGGGLALNWDVDMSRYSWRDVNGDGILDQIHKINNSTPPTVAFGTGTGILPPVQYGSMFSTTVAGIDAGQQISMDRTTSLGGGSSSPSPSAHFAWSRVT